MFRKFKKSFSKAAKADFADKMNKIDTFCFENKISKSKSSDSYYFNLNDTDYRVSNHTINASNSKAYNCLGVQVRELYHLNENKNTIYITASKTRIIEIYTNLKNGKKLNKRGYVID